MKNKKPNGQQFKSKMNKLSQIKKKKVAHTLVNVNDFWESSGYGQRYVLGEHLFDGFPLIWNRHLTSFVNEAIF